MVGDDILHYANLAIVITLMLSMPPIIVATVVGLLVSLFQAVTQLQEQSLPFALKLVALVVTLMAVVPWAGSQLVQYTQQLFDLIPGLGR
ncbi:MAG: type III secretion system export apparatus subunit SctS [Gammaproteobacteria bacterium]|nr:type III secretion system export apparatus subunit SctS [Gammaproteobacteria bacterium]